MGKLLEGKCCEKENIDIGKAIINEIHQFSNSSAKKDPFPLSIAEEFSCTLKKTGLGSPASLPTKKLSCWADRNKDCLKVLSGGPWLRALHITFAMWGNSNPNDLRSQTFIVSETPSGINWFRHDSNTFHWNHFQEFRTKKPQAGSQILPHFKE